MDLGLRGKAAVVTGGTSGVGLAVSRQLLAEGAKVAIIDRDADEVAKAVEVLRHEDDVGPSAVSGFGSGEGPTAALGKAVAEAAEWLGRIDIVVSNAGSQLRGDFDSLDMATVEAHLRGRVLDAWELARQTLPYLRKQDAGRLILIVGQAGKIPSRYDIASCVSEAARHALVKALSDHLGRDNVLVNAVCVGQTPDRPATDPQVEPERYLGQSLEHQEAGWGLEAPLGRMGTPEDVARAVAFLASERAAYLCGTNLDVDGGMQRMIF